MPKNPPNPKQEAHKLSQQKNTQDKQASTQTSKKEVVLERVNIDLLPKWLSKIGAEKMGEKIMQKKGEMLAFSLQDLSLPALNILKQEALSAGGDLATPREAILGGQKLYNALLIATHTQLEKIIYKCKIQPFGLRQIAKKLQSHLSTKSSQNKIIMPIINITPDSFYADSRRSSKKAIESIIALIDSGATLIDIGAASSRPGSELIKPSEEKKRLQEVCEFIKRKNLAKKASFSIDTYNAEVADFAFKHDFVMINDVSGIKSKKMLEVIAHYRAQVVLMHTKGTPKDMANLSKYTHLISEVDEFFERKIEELEAHKASRIVLDIGFGFAKNHAQNLALIQNLEHFKHFGYEILVGASRKSTIGAITNRQSPSERLSGSLALHLLALQNGADIIRTHDFIEHIDMLKILSAFNELC